MAQLEHDDKRMSKMLNKHQNLFKGTEVKLEIDESVQPTA